MKSSILNVSFSSTLNSMENNLNKDIFLINIFWDFWDTNLIWFFFFSFHEYRIF